MRKRLTMIGISSIVGVTAVLLCVSIATARLWVTDDDEYWQIDQTCRDGARISLINEQTIAAAPQPDKVIDVDMQARLLTRPFDESLIDPATGWFTSTESKADMAFYPLLSAGHNFSETEYQVTPFYADLDDDGSDDPNEDYFLLYTDGVVQWPQKLPVGTAVLFPANFGTILEQVENCTLNQLNVGEDVIIDPVHFGPDYAAVVSLDPANPAPFSIVAADDLLYEIEAVPAFGSLLLDGNLLAAGDVFSRTQLNTGVVRYQQSTPAPVTDAFSFSVRATYEGGLTDTVGVNPVDATISRFGRFEVSAVGNQIFVEDTVAVANCTIRVSENVAGEAGNGPSAVPSISADGRFVAFQSDAINLVAGDSNGVTDIFVYDRDADEDTSFYSDEANCVPGPATIFRVSIAGDGTQANGASTNPQISGNGGFVQFDSAATNLVPGVTASTFVHYIGFSAQIELTPPYAVLLPFVEK
jgi:hypothetical protein